MTDFCVVLVRPRDPNNIGACARALGNFGLSDLRVVDPYEPVWREAVSAVGVHEIMLSAKKCATLDEALADTSFSFASTALKNREIKQRIVPLPQLNERLQTAPGGRVALVFGNEKSGLSGEDIARCDEVLNIPTATRQLRAFPPARFCGAPPPRGRPAVPDGCPKGNFHFLPGPSLRKGGFSDGFFLPTAQGAFAANAFAPGSQPRAALLFKEMGRQAVRQIAVNPRSKS